MLFGGDWQAFGDKPISFASNSRRNT